MNIYKFNGKSDFLNCKPIQLSNAHVECLLEFNINKIFIYQKGIETVQNYLIIVRKEDLECLHKYISKDISWIDLIPIKTMDELLLANRLVKLK